MTSLCKSCLSTAARVSSVARAEAALRAATGIGDKTKSLVLGTGTRAERVRLLRQARGWSQRELAKVSGVGRTSINQVELSPRRAITLRTACQLADALGVDVRVLDC